MNELTIDEMIELLKMECPCSDFECTGVWLSRHESYEIIEKLRELKDAVPE
jgi:Zn-finger nucleic acid-binding protein